MGVISFSHRGNFKHAESFFKRVTHRDLYSKLEMYAQKGVDALQSATPRDSGTTAESWGYKIIKKHDSVLVAWTNSSSNEGIPIAILIQYGHSTKDGGYIQGIDFVNPAIRPIFEEIRDSIWKEVTAD